MNEHDHPSLGRWKLCALELEIPCLDYFFVLIGTKKENITVTLSRLALAKAIKTPDADEQESKPWNNSVIFHQPHISSDMLHQLLNPQDQRRSRRYRSEQQMPHHQHSSRLKHWPNDQPHPNRHKARHARSPHPQYHSPKRSSSSPLIHQGQSVEYQKLRNRQPPQTATNRSEGQPTQKWRTFYNSSDDDTEDDKDDASSQSSALSAVGTKDPLEDGACNPLSVMSRSSTPYLSSTLTTPKNTWNDTNPNAKTPLYTSSKDDLTQHSETVRNKWAIPPLGDKQNAKRISALRKLETGPLAHQESATSVGETINDPASNGQCDDDGDNFDQWGKMVLDELASAATTAASVPELIGSSENSSSFASSRIVDRDSASTPSVASTITTDHMNTTIAPLPTPSTDTSFPYFYKQPTTSFPFGDLDMMYYLQQQQMQQMFYQQQQLMVALQQQAVWQGAALQYQQQQHQQQQQRQQQQQQQQHEMATSRIKEKRLSGMDMMMQLEHDKKIKAEVSRRPKRIDPSQAPIVGLLAVANKTHDLASQQAAIKERAERMAGRHSSGKKDDRQQQQWRHSHQSMTIPGARSPSRLQPKRNTWRSSTTYLSGQ